MTNSVMKLQPGSKGPGTSKGLKLSLNERIHNKEPRNPRYYAEGFMAAEPSIEELAVIVQKGIAFSYQYENDYRKKENFIASDILSLDFDGGVTIEEMAGDPWIQEYASLLYTTVSHTAEEHRFRIVFILPRTIECANELQWATRALALRLGSDPSATDAARFFAGSEGCHVRLFGGSISPSLLGELIEDGRRPTKVEHSMVVPFVQNRSERPIRGSESIRLASGETMLFSQITGKTNVFCPYHMDHNPSAFVAETRRGKFLRCSSCQQTWWSEDARFDEHALPEFDKVVRDLKASPKLKRPDELVGLEEFMAPVEVLPKNIWLQSSRHLQVPEFMYRGVNDGLFFIKSPKGSGKTEFFSKLFKKESACEPSQLPDLSDDAKIVQFRKEPSEPSASEPSVLVVGHRKALIGQLCERVGLRSYLDCKQTKGFYADQKRMRRLGVCVDSLEMVKGQKYDVVVLDEVEQVLKHFLGGTVGYKRQRLFEYFASLIAGAKQVIALDADLGWLSFVTLNNLKNVSSIDPRTSGQEACPIHILLNDYPVADSKLVSFADKNHLIADMRAAAADQKRLFVTSNSKNLIESLHEALQAFAAERSIGLRTIAITSDNSTTVESQDFIKNIKDRILDYDVVLCSPSLGTGIDISFDGEQKIDCVYGFFESGITSHFDIDQQLCRVRHPKSTKVWVSPRCYNFETEFEIVCSEVLHSDLFGMVDYGNSNPRPQTQNPSFSFLTMATLAVVKDRASINRLRQNFLAAKRQIGWDIRDISRDEDAAGSGLAFKWRGDELARATYARGILNAKTICRADYERIRQRVNFGNGELTLQEKFYYRRTGLEVFYRETASPALIDVDKHGRYRGQVKMYEALKQVHRDGDMSQKIVLPYERKLLKRTHLSVLPDFHARTLLLHELLQTTPVYRDGCFFADVEYCHGDLTRFAEKARRMKPFLEGQLGISVRRDVKKKPMQFLGALLSMVGLGHDLKRQEKGERKSKARLYVLEERPLQQMNRICERRAEIDGWKFVRERYGFQDTLEDIEYLEGRAA